MNECVQVKKTKLFALSSNPELASIISKTANIPLSQLN